MATNKWRAALGAGLAWAVMCNGHALAQDTGMEALHEQYRVGGKLCFTEHTHYGNSSGQFASKAAAQKDAIESWRSFTDFEYGPRWASFNKAIAKKVACSQNGSSWECSIEARPCR